MIGSYIKRISTIIMVLILFKGGAYTLPLSRTCYITPSDVLDLYLGEEFVTDRTIRRIDVINLALGLNDYTTLGVRWVYLNRDWNKEGGRAGDTEIELFRYTGRYYKGKLDTGFSLAVLLPTGPDPAEDEEWRNLSTGRSEIKAGPVFSFNATEKEVLSFSFNYIFRQGEGDDFYGALGGNLESPDTYKSFFGLNPFYGDSFLSGDRLSDDYLSAAFSIMEKRLYPAVFYSELLYKSGYFNGGRGSDSERSADALTLVSAGIKYFISDVSFIHMNVNVNPFSSHNDRKWGTGAGINIFF